MRHRSQSLPWVVVLTLCGAPLAALDPQPHDEVTAAEKLGTVHFPVSCRADLRAPFERGVALLHSFGYGLAAGVFDEIAALDPSCAMAQWGRAMSQFHQIWAPPTAAELAAGAEAAKSAAALDARTDRERAWVAAIGAFYLESPPRQHLARVKSYEHAMADLSARFPDDDEAAVFHALALLSVAYNSPPDKSYVHQKEAAGILNGLLPTHSEHPGVAHYMIHSFDYPALAPLALDAARVYAKIAPSAPHALHMPSHIFTRLGLWRDSIASNLASSAAAREEVARTSPGTTSYNDLHALDYLEYGYLQLADDEAARGVAATVAAIAKVNVAEGAAAYALAAVPARYALERRAWREAAALTPTPASFPWSQFPQAEAAIHFARAVGAARAGDVEGARAAYGRLAELQAALAAGYTKGFDWPTQVEIQRLAAEGWLREAEGKGSEAERLLRAAAELEDRTDKHPVTPGSILPAREQLADLLVGHGQPGAALAEYEASLRTAPARYASYAGALAAAEKAGDSAAARVWSARLAELAAPSAQRPELARARKLAGRR
jgi:hypothetical protein